MCDSRTHFQYKIGDTSQNKWVTTIHEIFETTIFNTQGLLLDYSMNLHTALLPSSDNIS